MSTVPRRCEGCGNFGCLESFAAKNGIIATAQELVGRPALAAASSNWLKGDPQKITPRLVYQAARLGDPAAVEVFRRAGHALGLGLVSLADIVAPARIIIGGGIAQAGELLLGPARQGRARAGLSPAHPPGRNRPGGIGRPIRNLRRRRHGIS